MRLDAFLLLATIISIVGTGCCQNSSDSGKPTYVSVLEKTVQTFIKTGRMLNQGISIIKDDLKGVASHLPHLNSSEKNSEEFSEKNSTTITDILNPFKSRIKAIFPGTYWCGDGDISPNKDDLGLFEQTDACCRAHDSCPYGIAAGEERGGLLNNGIFTRSTCECDSEFYNCLKQIHSLVAVDIGTTYFNVLRPQCYRWDYPIKGCKKYARRRLLHDKCEEYIYDTSEPETLEWIDNPDFFNL